MKLKELNQDIDRITDEIADLLKEADKALREERRKYGALGALPIATERVQKLIYKLDEMESYLIRIRSESFKACLPPIIMLALAIILTVIVTVII